MPIYPDDMAYVVMADIPPGTMAYVVMAGLCPIHPDDMAYVFMADIVMADIPPDNDGRHTLLESQVKQAFLGALVAAGWIRDSSDRRWTAIASAQEAASALVETRIARVSPRRAINTSGAGGS